MVFRAAASTFDVLWVDTAEPVTSRCERWYLEGQREPPSEPDILTPWMERIAQENKIPPDISQALSDMPVMEWQSM